MKIVVGGALNKKENGELIEQYGNGRVEVTVKIGRASCRERV